MQKGLFAQKIGEIQKIQNKKALKHTFPPYFLEITEKDAIFATANWKVSP